MRKLNASVVALVQARMSSRRLPGKVLLPCGSSTFLDQQIKRIRASQQISKIVVQIRISRFFVETSMMFFIDFMIF